MNPYNKPLLKDLDAFCWNLDVVHLTLSAVYIQRFHGELSKSDVMKQCKTCAIKIQNQTLFWVMNGGNITSSAPSPRGNPIQPNPSTGTHPPMGGVAELSGPLPPSGLVPVSWPGIPSHEARGVQSGQRELGHSITQSERISTQSETICRTYEF